MKSKTESDNKEICPCCNGKGIVVGKNKISGHICFKCKGTGKIILFETLK